MTEHREIKSTGPVNVTLPLTPPESWRYIEIRLADLSLLTYVAVGSRDGACCYLDSHNHASRKKVLYWFPKPFEWASVAHDLKQSYEVLVISDSTDLLNALQAEWAQSES